MVHRYLAQRGLGLEVAAGVAWIQTGDLLMETSGTLHTWYMFRFRGYLAIYIYPPTSVTTFLGGDRGDAPNTGLKAGVWMVIQRHNRQHESHRWSWPNLRSPVQYVHLHSLSLFAAGKVSRGRSGAAFLQVHVNLCRPRNEECDESVAAVFQCSSLSSMSLTDEINFTSRREKARKGGCSRDLPVICLCFFHFLRSSTSSTLRSAEILRSPTFFPPVSNLRSSRPRHTTQNAVDT